MSNRFPNTTHIINHTSIFVIKMDDVGQYLLIMGKITIFFTKWSDGPSLTKHWYQINRLGKWKLRIRMTKECVIDSDVISNFHLKYIVKLTSDKQGIIERFSIPE